MSDLKDKIYDLLRAPSHRVKAAMTVDIIEQDLADVYMYINDEHSMEGAAENLVEVIDAAYEAGLSDAPKPDNAKLIHGFLRWLYVHNFQVGYRTNDANGNARLLLTTGGYGGTTHAHHTMSSRVKAYLESLEGKE